MNLSISALTLCAIALLAHFVSAASLAHRSRSRLPSSRKFASEGVALVRTIRDVGPLEAHTLASTFALDWPGLEILFCAASRNDPAVPLVRQLIAKHPKVPARLLIGDDIVSTNAKLNNMVKGWREAGGSWVLFADSNLLLPSDYVERVLSAWTPSAGAVCAPPVGSEPDGLWAEVECGFLNGYQARWQYAADAVGLGFAQGKTMLLRRDIIDLAGGIAALGREPAEDAALTKVVRAQGRTVRLADPIFTQPLGRRSLQQVVDRQARWAQLRRATFPFLYALEILSGMALPLSASILAAPSLKCPAVAVGTMIVVLWLAIEAALNWVAGWHISWKSPLAWLLREILLPFVWVRGWLSSCFEWGGRTVVLDQPLTHSARASSP